MRSKNYNNQTASFTPLQPNQMVRVALAEGMKPQYPEPERQRYRRLVKQYLGIDETRVDRLFSLLEVEDPSEPQQVFLNDILVQVAYDSRYWHRRGFDYDALKKEGIIIEHDGNLNGLARLVQEIDESKVIFVPRVGERAVAPEHEPDYLKHVSWRNKLVLNGRDVVTKFAENKGFQLPEKYLENGYMSVEVMGLLEKHGFYFNEALKTAIEVLKDPKYENRVISTMSIKRTDGSELRLHPHDFVEAAEFYIYSLRYKKEIIETLGGRLSLVGDKYHGVNTFNVPKRVPIGRKTHNEVVLHYFPEQIENGHHPLDWMNTRVTCNCPHALNMTNMETRSKRQARVLDTMDTHANMVFLAEMHKKEISPEDAVNNMSPIPTEELSRRVDITRYNLVKEFREEGLGKGRLKRTYAGEEDIEKIIHELAKDPEWTFERMFNPQERVGAKLLRPMYV